jgi:ketosteroid isomerase-like protein
MKRFLKGMGALVVALSLNAQAADTTADAGALAAVRQFIESFNAGNLDGARAAHAANPTIVDEVPPFHWQGPGAFDAWFASLNAHDAARGVTDGKVTLGDVVRQESAGDGAYVVMAARYAFKEKGVAMSAPAQMTFALAKAADGWRIVGWTYASPRGTPVTP